MWSTKSYTLHFDGSPTNQFQKSGAGCIIRDNKGDLVVAASYNLGDTHPDSTMNVAIAEATALSNGLKLAQSFKIKLDLIKGDSTEVINHVRGQASRVCKPSLSKIIEEIKAALRVQNIDPFSQIELITREGNGVADILASEGSKLWRESRVYNSEYDLPAKAAQLVREEKSLYGGRGGFRNFNTGLSTNNGSSSNSDLVETIAMAGAAIAGIATVAWGISKLFSGSGSNDQDKDKAKAKSPLSIWDMNTQTNRSPIDREFNVLHVDGLDSQESKQAAAGCIIRDKHGDLVMAAAYNLDYCYPHCHIGIAEAMSLKKGLELARESSIKLHLIKMDNEEVVDRVIDRDRRPPKMPPVDRGH